MYLPNFFKPFELLPRELFCRTKKPDGLLSVLFDDRILKAADRLRDQYGPMQANDWFWGGPNQFRGFRPFDCPVGAKLSQHKFGRAIDLLPLDAPVDDIRSDLIEHPAIAGGLVTCIEADVPWLHIDCRNHNPENGLLVIRP